MNKSLWSKARVFDNNHGKQKFQELKRLLEENYSKKIYESDERFIVLRTSHKEVFIEIENKTSKNSNSYNGYFSKVSVYRVGSENNHYNVTWLSGFNGNGFMEAKTYSNLNHVMLRLQELQEHITSAERYGGLYLE